jgi:hypothetical protein
MATAKKTSASTAVATRKSGGSIVSIQEALKAQAAAMVGRIAPPTGNTIKVTQDKKFLLPDGNKVDGPLDLVVVDFTNKNTYYEGAYDPNNISAPNCFAIHQIVKEMAPSNNAPDKQCDDCASCPMNQFGSAGKGKACKNTRVLAVLPPDADESTPLWLLNVSPTAIKGFDSFVGAVNRTYEMPPIATIVEVDFNPAETFASLTFSNPRPNENLAAHYPRQEEARALLAVEPDVSSFGQTTAKAVSRPVARKPAVGARR